MKVAIIDVAAIFPLSGADFFGPARLAIKLSVELGVAYAVGFSKDSVEVTRVNGRPADTEAKLLEGDFHEYALLRISITSNSTESERGRALQGNLESEAVRALQERVEAAFLTGMVVSSVQRQAARNGVLTPALNAMPKKLTVSSTVRFVIKNVVVDRDSSYSDNYAAATIIASIMPTTTLPATNVSARNYTHILDTLDSYTQYYVL